MAVKRSLGVPARCGHNVSMGIIEDIGGLIGQGRVLTGEDAAPYGRDWMGVHETRPLAVVRPGSTGEVAAIMRRAHEEGVPVVPISGNTGLTGATRADGALMLSLERMTAIRAMKPEARVMVAEAGCVLSTLHDAAAEHSLVFPLTFGARGQARLGGALSTNAGGSNVLRYGSTRGLCLGIEAVMADGRVMNLLGELHKDNAGYALKDLLVGAEGTLGIVTAASLKLFPAPQATVTMMLAPVSLSAALTALNRLQAASGGAVEAFEYMPRTFVEGYMTLGGREPFDAPHPINVLAEIGVTSDAEAEEGADGTIPAAAKAEAVLAALFEDGLLSDAVIASSGQQRAEMWARREAAAEIARLRKPHADFDVAVGLDAVERFLAEAREAVRHLDPEADVLEVAHLGDGNVHYTVYYTGAVPKDEIVEAVEDVVQRLGGSFSAEHGIGTDKLNTMRRRKDPTALDAMRAIKAALDPKGILNPGKVIPD